MHTCNGEYMKLQLHHSAQSHTQSQVALNGGMWISSKQERVHVNVHSLCVL